MSDKIVYIDLGATGGETIRSFLTCRSFCPELAVMRNIEVYGFEPVDYAEAWRETIADFPTVKIRVFNKAVGTENKKVRLSLHSNPEAHTVLTDNVNYAEDTAIEVDQVDIVEWLWDNVLWSDTIILKLDIEGAEYGILEKLIESGYANFIDHIFVEFHNWLLPAEYAEREKKIRENFPMTIGHWG